MTTPKLPNLGPGGRDTFATLRTTNPAATHNEVPPVADQTRSAAHVIHGLGYNLAHASRHLDAAQSADSPDSQAYNLKHAKTHTDAAITEHGQLVDSVGLIDPGVTDELAAIHAVKHPETVDTDNDRDASLWKTFPTWPPIQCGVPRKPEATARAATNWR